MTVGSHGTVDVRDLPDGPHGVEIVVEDAAGNEDAVFGPIEFPRLNAPGGSGVADDVKSVLNAKLRMWFVKAPLKTRKYCRLTLILPNNVDTRTIEYAYRALRPGPITSRVRLRLTVIRNGAIFRQKSKSKR